MKIKEMIENFKKKLRIVIITCPKCRSMEVTFGEKHHYKTVDRDNNITQEVYDVRCKNCGIIGEVKESWKYEENNNGGN